MSEERSGIPFRHVVDLCARHGFQLMRAAGDSRVFHRAGHYDVAAAHTWVSVEVEVDRTVRVAVFHRLQEYFQDYCDQQLCCYLAVQTSRTVQVG